MDDLSLIAPMHPIIAVKKAMTPTKMSPIAGAWNATTGKVVCGGFTSQLQPTVSSSVIPHIFEQYLVAVFAKLWPARVGITYESKGNMSRHRKRT